MNAIAPVDGTARYVTGGGRLPAHKELSVGLAGSTAALVAALASSHSLAASIIAGTIVAIVGVAALMEYQLSVWLRYAVESEDASDVATE
jgi:hypothetical protein